MCRIKIIVSSSEALYQKCVDPIHTWKMINGNWEIILEAVNIRKALNTAKAVAAVHPHIAPGNTDIVQKISVLISNF